MPEKERDQEYSKSPKIRSRETVRREHRALKEAELNLVQVQEKGRLVEAAEMPKPFLALHTLIDP